MIGPGPAVFASQWCKTAPVISGRAGYNEIDKSCAGSVEIGESGGLQNRVTEMARFSTVRWHGTNVGGAGRPCSRIDYTVEVE